MTLTKRIKYQAKYNGRTIKERIKYIDQKYLGMRLRKLMRKILQSKLSVAETNCDN